MKGLATDEIPEEMGELSGQYELQSCPSTLEPFLKPLCTVP